MLAQDGALPGQNYLWLDRMESFDFTQAGIQFILISHTNSVGTGHTYSYRVIILICNILIGRVDCICQGKIARKS
jgi:hypothetical protein